MNHDGLALYRCRRCDQLWTSNANPAAITTRMFCPNCIPLVTHQISDRALGELIAYERPPRAYACTPATERLAS